MISPSARGGHEIAEHKLDPAGLNAPPVIPVSSAPGKALVNVADVCKHGDAFVGLVCS